MSLRHSITLDSIASIRDSTTAESGEYWANEFFEDVSNNRKTTPTLTM
jgi:hypothetical protein